MTAGQDRAAELAGTRARLARDDVERAEAKARKRTMEYVDLALAAGWPWPKIGAALGNSATGVRRYYQRNRRHHHGGDA